MLATEPVGFEGLHRIIDETFLFSKKRKYKLKSSESIISHTLKCVAKLVRGGDVIVLRQSVHSDGDASAHLDHVRVGGPIGRGDEHLVA